MTTLLIHNAHTIATQEQTRELVRRLQVTLAGLTIAASTFFRNDVPGTSLPSKMHFFMFGALAGHLRNTIPIRSFISFSFSHRCAFREYLINEKPAIHWRCSEFSTVGSSFTATFPVSSTARDPDPGVLG